MAIAGYSSMLMLIVIGVPLITAASQSNTQGTVQNELSRFDGEWRGNSSCVAKNTACRDETVVYHIAELPKKSGHFSVAADKLVNGQPVNMGTLEFQYDQDQQALVCEYSQGVWRLKLQGQKMEGNLIALNGTVFRRVTLSKEP